MADTWYDNQCYQHIYDNIAADYLSLSGATNTYN